MGVSECGDGKSRTRGLTLAVKQHLSEQGDVGFDGM